MGGEGRGEEREKERGEGVEREGETGERKEVGREGKGRGRRRESSCIHILPSSVVCLSFLPKGKHNQM
jgi:hypothetical protein